MQATSYHKTRVGSTLTSLSAIASGDGSELITYVALPGVLKFGVSKLSAQLTVSAEENSATTPTLDVMIQSTLDPTVAYDSTSTLWFDVLDMASADGGDQITSSAVTGRSKEVARGVDQPFGQRWRVVFTGTTAATAASWPYELDVFWGC